MTVNEFINSFLPDNISKKKRQQLYDEMECHILDRADFYIEIGYDEETALKKSMECFGEENEMKESIKKDFEELYHERWYYALIAGLIPLIFNVIAAFTGNFIHTADYAGSPSAENVFMSSLFVCFVILQIMFCYKKGYRKSLIATGISNILIICTLIVAFYPQSALYALPLNISYILEKLTPLIMKNPADDLPNIFSWYGTLLFLGGTALISFILAKRIKIKGRSERKSLKGIAVLAFIMCGMCFLNGATYRPAKDYFREYRIWFDDKDDTVSEQSLEIFDLIPLGCTYDDAKAYLEYLGYVNTEDYIKTLSREEQKMFRYNLGEMKFFFGEDYEIFFEKDKEYYRRDENAFFFVRADEKGTITGKGIGVGSEYEDRYGSKHHHCSADNNTDKCIADFENLKKGDGKDETLRKLGEENGHFYTVFSENENGVQKDYYRVHSHGKPKGNYYHNTDLYIQLWFTDELLEKGRLEYYDHNHGGKEIVMNIP